MSLILDAINRADRDRHSDQSNAAIDQPVPPLNPLQNVPARSLRYWWLALALLLVLLLVVLWQWRGSSATTDVVSAQTAQLSERPVKTKGDMDRTIPPNSMAADQAVQQQPPIAAETAGGTPDNSPQAALSAAANDPAIQQLYRQSASKPANSTAVSNTVTTANQQLPEDATPDPALIAEMEAQAKALLAGRQQSDAASSRDQLRSSNTVARLGGNAAPAVPSLNQLPWPERKRIPTINYSVHIYSDDRPNASTVELNGKLRRAGDTIAPGLRLESIDSLGVILDYQGSRFRLPALNSWINN